MALQQTQVLKFVIYVYIRVQHSATTQAESIKQSRLNYSQQCVYCGTNNRPVFLLTGRDDRSEGDHLTRAVGLRRNGDHVGGSQILSKEGARLPHPAAFRVGVGVAVVVVDAKRLTSEPETGEVPCFDRDSLPWCQCHAVIVTSRGRDVEHGLADEFKPVKSRDELASQRVF